MFVESLALASFDIDYSEDISSIEKVLFYFLNITKKKDLLSCRENESI